MKMNKVILIFIVCMSNFAFALTINNKGTPVKNYCGAYASVIKKDANKYEIFSNAIPNAKAVCPGAGCPGIVRYFGSMSSPSFYGIVANNSIIDDVYDADGTLAKNRMFSRPVVVKDGLGYAAVAMVMNGYPAVDGQGVPAFLTSTDGLSWMYHGKFGGEPFERSLFGSGMALIVDPDASPRYRFYTDGYGVSMAGLTSDGNNEWTFIKNIHGNIAELKPPEWKGAIFHSMAELNGVFYMAASDTWPVTAWQIAHSEDGVNWVNDLIEPVREVQKNLSLYIDNNTLMALATTSLAGSNCYRKTAIEINP
jgi:hypothetical protein